jgi:hypothetical protein
MNEMNESIDDIAVLLNTLFFLTTVRKLGQENVTVRSNHAVRDTYGRMTLQH